MDAVASDISKDLDNRINKNGFYISLQPWSARKMDIPEADHRTAFVLGEVKDQRADPFRIGERTAAFGVSMGDVFFNREVADFMSDTVTSELVAQEHTIGSDGEDRVLSITVNKFWVRTDTTALYWDAIGNIEIAVSLDQPVNVTTKTSNDYSCETRERTYVWPTEKLLARVLGQCLH